MNRYLITYYKIYEGNVTVPGDVIIESHDILHALKTFIAKEVVVTVLSIHQLNVEDYTPKF